MASESVMDSNAAQRQIPRAAPQQPALKSPTAAGKSPSLSPSFPLMVIAQHGIFFRSYGWTELADISLCVDFPGTGDDEISFSRGEIIVVIAKDDGFGDGWWTVNSLASPSLYMLVSLYLLCVSSCVLILFQFDFIGHGRWGNGGLSHMYIG
jgi:hypothetical protein